MSSRRRGAAALLALGLIAGCGSASAGDRPAAAASAPAASRPATPSVTPSTTPSTTPSASATSAVDAAAGFRSPRTYADVALPVRLRIPVIGVDASLEQLGLASDGTIAAPRRWEDAGWYTAGPRPGQPGPAVILGHVDSVSGPAVFYRLAGLAPGTLVLVDRADGSTVRFRVSGKLQVAKSQFPADLVYGPTLAPSLRLVTCGGVFDRRTRHYTDNIVLTAVPEQQAP